MVLSKVEGAELGQKNESCELVEDGRETRLPEIRFERTQLGPALGQTSKESENLHR